jgi:hypothetical protein
MLFTGVVSKVVENRLGVDPCLTREQEMASATLRNTCVLHIDDIVCGPVTESFKLEAGRL